MSLGDHLRFLRAMNDGIDTATIAEAIGEERPWPINEIEVRYREIGDDDLLRRLAEYYEQPVEEFFWHRERSRKKLTIFIAQATQANNPVALQMRSGKTLAGVPQWWDLGTIGLQQEGDDTITVVQRHAVVDWKSGD